MIPGAQTPFDFDGKTYVPERDQERLSGQLLKVYEFMQSGKWYTLAEIAKAIGAPEASVSSRIRDLRKPRFGAHEVQRRHLHEGLHEYRLIERKA